MSQNGREEQKKVYIPYMCDHGYIIEAALQAHRIPAELLPPPDPETMAIGVNMCKGRECLPIFTTTGDVIRRARQPDFNPQQARVFMPTVTSACRFGQYTVLQKSIFQQLGMGGIEMMSPDANNSYQGFGDRPGPLRRLIWQSGVAIDLLQKLLHEYRPYELNRGETDALYQQVLERIVAATRANSTRQILDALKLAAEQFEALPIDRRERRPIIGLVGEVYIRHNRFINQNLIQHIEQMGGEVMIASMIEWVYYTNWKYMRASQMFGRYGEMLKTSVIDTYQKRQEIRLTRLVKHLLTEKIEPPTARLMDHIRPYYNPELGSECVLSLGRAIEFAHHGISGIINVLPFTCMPGTIATSIAPRVRADLQNIPWLDIAFDAQEMTNIRTRLEAFMYQATQFHRRVAQPATA